MRRPSPPRERAVVNLLRTPRRPARPLLALSVVGVLALGLPVAGAASASAAAVDWVDGGDSQHCLQDDMGAALTQLAEDKWCQPIPSCHEYDGNNPRYKGRIVHSSASDGIWQGPADEVLYADDLPADYNLTTPTPSPTRTPAPRPTPAPGKTPAPGTTPAPEKTPADDRTPAPRGTSAPRPDVDRDPAAAPADPDADLGIDPDEQIAEGAPSAPGTPTVTVDGTTVVVTWAPTADAELEGVTGYVVLLTGGNRAEVGPEVTTHEFPDLPDGFYRAAVRAVNGLGESAASTPSEPVTLGTPVASVVGTLTWEGDVTAGSGVVLTGTGYAPDAELDVELHSDPVHLTTVTTDGDGSFTADVVVPQETPAGEHHLVVTHQGAVVSESAVTVAALVAAPAVADADAPVTGTEDVPRSRGWSSSWPWPRVECCC